MAKGQKEKDKDEKEQNKTSEQYKESVDTNDLVWEMYKMIYKDGELSKYFNIENCTIESKTQKNTRIERKYAPINDEGKKIFGENIQLSGDVIFNFSDTRCNGYENSIEEDYNVIRQIEYKEKLEECKKMHDSFENCALMISTGKLQQTKQHIGNDRGDVFVWALDEYYKGNNERVLEWAPKDKARILREFLNYFHDVYKYCEVFYNITDKGFIDRLIQSGSKALDSADKVENYIDLALKFWDERAEYMKKSYKRYINENLDKETNDKIENIIALRNKEYCERINKNTKRFNEDACKNYGLVYKKEYNDTNNNKEKYGTSNGSKIKKWLIKDAVGEQAKLERYVKNYVIRVENKLHELEQQNYEYSLLYKEIAKAEWKKDSKKIESIINELVKISNKDKINPKEKDYVSYIKNRVEELFNKYGNGTSNPQKSEQTEVIQLENEQHKQHEQLTELYKQYQEII